MAKIAAFANHKGGVCKTTLLVNSADTLAREGLDVLVVDLDPQANLTSLVYSFDEAPSTPIERVLDGSASLAEAIITTTRIDGVHLVGATLKLSKLERNLQQTPFSSTQLVADMLGAVADVYDVILLDCPPSLGFLPANALAAADMVVVPIESGSKLSLVGTDDMLAFIGQARRANPRLVLGGAILTKHDARTKVCKIMAGAVRGYYAEVFEATMPDSTEVKKAQLLGKTVIQHDRDHTAARAALEIGRELMGKLGLQRKPKGADDGQ